MLEIDEVARQSGLPASTLRFYEKEGLISSVGRRGIRRIFEPDILIRLSLIQLGQKAGFSLSQIASMLGSSGTPQIDREKLQQQAKLLEEKIHELTSLRRVLLHVTTCTAPSHLECPTFQRLMRRGTRRQKGRHDASLG
jgi:DNA-binding transcriptional MerR regulator